MTLTRTLALALSACGLAAGLTAGLATEAAATIRRPPAHYPQGYVVAESRFGNGTVSGPVRPTSVGWQVRLPGGTWVHCRRSCSETLRVETVDFWQSNAAGSGQITNECGIFGCLELRYPR